MSQNLAAFVGKNASGNVVLLATDGTAAGSGNLNVNVAAGSITLSGGNVTVTQAVDTYVTCPGNATTQLGGNGATGDTLQSIVITPDVVNPGNVAIKDGATSIQVYNGTGGNLSNQVPFEITLGPGVKSQNGAWSVTLPGNVSAIAIGKFTP